MKKQMFMILTIFALLLAVLPVMGQEELRTEPLPAFNFEELTVGVPTRMEGNFFTGMWGNNSADLDVRMLLNGYNLVTWDSDEGLFIFDPSVVNGGVVNDDESGNRTYRISLYSDLRYSDGTQITAKDYAFSILFGIAPEIEALGGKPLRFDHIMGSEEYRSGLADTLSGVRLISDSEFEVTIRREYLPFFYELGLLYCTPMPIHVIAPGCEIRDDGNGVYIDGPFSADLLQQTVMDSDTGFLSHPSVSSGPYVLTSFDGTAAEFEINPNYKGDKRSMLPGIPRLIFTAADNETMIDELRDGRFGLLNKVTMADSVSAGIALSGEEGFSASNYERVGLTFIAFAGERPAVNSKAVRQAVAYCLDKDALVGDYVGNYGLRVDGYYGLGQWMYQLVNGTLSIPLEEPEDPTPEEQQKYEDDLARWEDLSLDSIHRYGLDVSEAVKLLEEDGWTLNRDGGSFVSGKDDVRCKMDGDELIALDLTLAYPEENRIAESMEKNFVPGLNQAGIRLTLVPRTMGDILDIFYRRAQRDVDMVYLGTNFDVVFDPSAHFIPGESGGLTWNYTETADDELYEYAVKMRQTQPGDVLSYCENWLLFQSRFAEVLPMIPIYSNIYFDFYTSYLHDYNIRPNVSWTETIIPAYLDEVPEIPADADTDEGEEFFSE